MGDPKIAPLIGGWPVFKTWLACDFRKGTTAADLILVLLWQKAHSTPSPSAAWFFKPFNSTPAPFLLEGWRENFLWIEGQPVIGRFILVTGAYTPECQSPCWILALNAFCCYFFAPSFHKIQSGILHPGTFGFDHSGPRRGKRRGWYPTHSFLLTPS